MYIYSPGLWPNGVLDNEYWVVRLIPPTPQSGSETQNYYCQESPSPFWNHLWGLWQRVQFYLPKITPRMAKCYDSRVPKPVPNPSKIGWKSECPEIWHSSPIYWSTFLSFVLFASSAKCIKHRKNCGFVALQAFLQCAFLDTADDQKTHEKCTQNPSKMSLQPFKLDAKNVLLCNINFFRLRLRIWRVLGFQDGAMFAQNWWHLLRKARSECIGRFFEASVRYFLILNHFGEGFWKCLGLR